MTKQLSQSMSINNTQCKKNLLSSLKWLYFMKLSYYCLSILYAIPCGVVFTMVFCGR